MQRALPPPLLERRLHDNVNKRLKAAVCRRRQLVPRLLRTVQLEPQLPDCLKRLPPVVQPLRKLAHHKRVVPVLVRQPPVVGQVPVVPVAPACQLLLLQH